MNSSSLKEEAKEMTLKRVKGQMVNKNKSSSNIISNNNNINNKRARREDSPDVTEALRSIRAKKGGSEGSSSSGSGGSSEEEEDEEEVKGHTEEEDEEDEGERSSSCSGGDPEEDSNFGDFPPELEFMGGGKDKTKRRTDRYDSSESSDSGVATLSPSTSDSTELSSPFSPCCDLSSDASSTISSSSCGSIPSSPECPRTQSPIPPNNNIIKNINSLHQQQQPQTILLGHPIMTALSLGDSSIGSPKVTNSVQGSKVTSATTTTNTNGIISFQIPTGIITTKTTPSTPVAPLIFNPINKLQLTPKISSTTISQNSQQKVTKVIPLLPKTNSISLSCDSNQSSRVNSNVRRNSSGAEKKGGPAIKNIFATALNFHQQQQQQQKDKLISNNNNVSKNNNNNNNNNSTTINKNHPEEQQPSDLMNKSPLRGSNTTSSKVILVKKNGLTSPLGSKKQLQVVSPTASSGSNISSTNNAAADLQQASSPSKVIKKSLNLIKSSNMNKNNNSANITGNQNSIKTSSSSSSSVLNSSSNSTTDLLLINSSPGATKKARLTSKNLKVITAEILGAALKVSEGDLGPKKTEKLLESPPPTLLSSTLSPKSKYESCSKKPSPLPSKPDSLPSSLSPLSPSSIRNRKRKLNWEGGSSSSCSSSSSSMSSTSSISLDSSSSISSVLNSVVVLNSLVELGSSISANKVSLVTSALCLTSPKGQISSASSFSISGSPIKPVLVPVVVEGGCMWKGCRSTVDLCHNILEHIQTVHVESQQSLGGTDGYHCLWEGCKVYSKKSSSLSWLVRHVLSHSGNKPFKCIFPGCGQSFGTQGALERHVNSHISTYGTAAQASLAKSKLDNSPMKANRRKKQRCRKQRVNPGQYVDYFDKRVMEVIKHRLATSTNYHTVNAHDCTFKGEVVARRTELHQGPQVLVHWYPESIIPDEWVLQREFIKSKSSKLVPLTKISKEKLVLLYPTLLPPPRPEKASRKSRPRSSSTGSSVSSGLSGSSSLSGSSGCGLSGSTSPFSMMSSSSSTSSTDSTISDYSTISLLKSENSYLINLDIDEGIAHCSSSRKSSKKQQKNKVDFTSRLATNSNNSKGLKYLHGDNEEDDDKEVEDWAMELLTNELIANSS